jgi:hypothetical protein
MSVEVSSSVECSESPTGRHEWECITVQRGEIVGVDDTGAPVFIPDDTVDREPDSPCWALQAYGCAHCSEPWTDTSATTTI